jgi:predicted RNA-binding Zn ribbon-like protein
VELGHDTDHALATVVELVNTSPQLAGDEGLTHLDDLHEFIARWQISDIRELTDKDLDAVRRLRARLLTILHAPDDQHAIDLINALVADAHTTPRLTDHDGFPVHIHYFAPGARLAEHLAAEQGMALARLVAAGERDRLRTCEAPDCQRVLIDLSRNRSRRYCDSRTCGNRLHVAAYRERRRAATA